MYRIGIILIGLILIPGCGGPQPRTVSGTVTANGEAIPTGSVTFIATKVGNRVATEIGSDGKYTAKVLPGEYKVVVVSVEDRNANDLNKDNWTESFSVESKSYVPGFYGDPEKTPLSLTVTDDAVQSYDVVVELKNGR